MEWLQQGAGAFGRDKAVTRAAADAAKIVEIGGSRSGSRTVSRVEADQYVADLERFIADRKEALQTAQQQRAEALAHVVPTCPHCNVTRRYAGRRMLQTGNKVGEVLFGEMLAVSNVATEVYVCPTCGSMELFLSRRSTRCPGRRRDSVSPRWRRAA